MSYGQSSAFGWPLWGALLLTIPIAFVVGPLLDTLLIGESFRIQLCY